MVKALGLAKEMRRNLRRRCRMLAVSVETLSILREVIYQNLLVLHIIWFISRGKACSLEECKHHVERFEQGHMENTWETPLFADNIGYRSYLKVLHRDQKTILTQNHCQVSSTHQDFQFPRRPQQFRTSVIPQVLPLPSPFLSLNFADLYQSGYSSHLMI